MSRDESSVTAHGSETDGSGNNCSSKKNPCVSLMLHCPDGAFPHLTPFLIERCFPASSVSDVLSLGLAVRDICVVPQATLEGKKGKGNRGFAFSVDADVDSWLHQFRRIAVPTFDMWDDAIKLAPSNAVKKMEYKTLISATESYVHMWTVCGRVPLGPQVFRRAAHKLVDSSSFAGSVVPLFEELPKVHDENETHKGTDKPTKPGINLAKRGRAALDRTRTFTIDLVDNGAQHVWYPIVVDGSLSLQNFVGDQLQLLQDQLAGFEGVALAGWHNINPEEGRRSCLQQIVSCIPPSSSILAMSSQSLLQVLELARVSSELSQVVVGTNLPSLWATAGKAFVFDFAFEQVAARASKRPRMDSSILEIDTDGCVVLEELEDTASHPWFADSGPIVATCKCLTCQTHSRAYVYHLVCAKEMLASILLFVHNLHHMIELVRYLNEDRTRPDAVISLLKSLKS